MLVARYTALKWTIFRSNIGSVFMKFLPILFVFCLSLLGCGSDDDNLDIMEPAPLVDSIPPEVEVIACPEVAGQSDYEDGLAEHVTDSHRFLDLYLAADPYSQDELPEPDFTEVDVLAVLAGAQPNGAHSVFISEVNEEGDDLEVVYVLVSPSEGCMATDQMIYPYCFVSIPKMQGEVRFTKGQVSACGLELDGEAVTE